MHITFSQTKIVNQVSNECLTLFQACKFSLRLLGPLLESEAINNKFQKYLLEDANLIYGEFMNDLAKCIVSIQIICL